MKKEKFSSKSLKTLFNKKKILTIEQIKDALATNNRMTVFRKLRNLSYHSSYSHRGRYYALDELIDFNNKGLWEFQKVYFSKYGTLLSTLKAFVNNSKAGYSCRELEKQLNVSLKQPLLRLFDKGAIGRKKFCGRYIYYSVEPSIKRRQLLFRKDMTIHMDIKSKAPIKFEADRLSDELKAAIILFFSFLDEKQRRLYAGLESLKFGHGGDSMIAKLLSLDVHTVAKGKFELINKNTDTDTDTDTDTESQMERVRQPGGGRKPIKKKHHK